MRWRLSLLMFLQYAAPGAWVPVFSLRLQELDFTPLQIGWASACYALGALLAPLVAGQVADRWIASERCISCCGLAAGLLLWLLAELHEPLAVFVCCLAFWLVMTPALTLGVALAFAHLPAPERHYGRVRLWGTVGWVVPNLVLGVWLASPEVLRPLLVWLRPEAPYGVLADSQRLGGLLCFALAAYAWTLPHTPPARQGRAWLAPLAALHLLRQRPFAVFAACSVGLCISLSFFQQVTPLLLAHLGVPSPWISPTLTLGQSMEVLSLVFLPVLLLRLGVRATMLLGMAAWGVAVGVLMLGRPLGLVIGSLGLYGVCISCFLVAGQVFMNRRAGRDIRASAQGLLTFLNGVGLLVGNVLVGWVRDRVEGDFPLTFAAAGAVLAPLLVVFLVGFFPDGVAAVDEVVAAEEVVV
jgi:MFS family permease